MTNSSSFAPACRKLGGEPDGSWLAGTAAATAGSSSQQQHQQQQLISPRDACPVSSAAVRALAGAAGAAAGDDARLLRPVNPAKPGYYWKPVKGDAAAAGHGLPHGSDYVLGFQVTAYAPGLCVAAAVHIENHGAPASSGCRTGSG